LTIDGWAIAVLPLVGVVLGAMLQFWLSRVAEREKHTDALQTQAYADYLRAVAAAAHWRSNEELRDAHRDNADAKARIAVYGDTSVIEALARFEDAGANLSTERSRQAFISLVSCMRSGAAVVNRDLELVLFSARVPNDGSETSVA
jgi:hypothetical protein